MSRAGADINNKNQEVKSLLSKLPEALRGHVVGVAERADELVILADSAAWAARLRLAVAELPMAGGRRMSVKLMPAGATDR
jgi:hypothetical protein